MAVPTDIGGSFLSARRLAHGWRGSEPVRLTA